MITALGGTSAVAEMLGTSYSAVANWRHANQFPAHSYLILKKALSSRKRSASDDLWSMGRRAARDE